MFSFTIVTRISESFKWQGEWRIARGWERACVLAENWCQSQCLGGQLAKSTEKTLCHLPMTAGKAVMGIFFLSDCPLPFHPSSVPLSLCRSTWCPQQNSVRIPNEESLEAVRFLDLCLCAHYVCMCVSLVCGTKLSSCVPGQTSGCLASHRGLQTLSLPLHTGPQCSAASG